MKQELSVITRKVIPNPDYNEEEAKKLKELDVTPPITKEIEEVKRTSVVINGVSDVCMDIADFIKDTFDEVE